MRVEEALKSANDLLSPWAIELTNPESSRLDAVIAPEALLEGVRALHDSPWGGYLAAITGLDLGVEGGALEVLYHFCKGPAVVTLRVRLPRTDPHIPSVCGLIPAASMYERELIEMFGITVEDTPNPNRLFLPDDWPDGVYPLRKDFDRRSLDTAPATPPAVSIKEPVFDAAPAPRLATGPDGSQKFFVPIGPQHPALKEPGHFEFTVDGETITGASIRLGYVHRGLEKAAEERSWVQNLYLFERVCGICSHIHAVAYCLGVEKLAGVEVPPRAHAIRELVAGLERIHSHLLWLGVAAHEGGFDTLFMYSWRDRETVMDLLEGFSGNRVNYSVNLLGGVKVDLNEEIADSIRKGMDYLEQRSRHYLDVVTTDLAFLKRTRGVGKTTRDQAEAFGLVGPTARASGVARDIRIDAPYGSYTTFPVSLVREDAGDLEAKFIVRIKELFVSYATIRTILDHMPEGDLTTRMPRKIPAGETISRVEAPRGELFYFIKSNGSDRPERIHVRTPSIANFTSVGALVVGHQLADAPMILAGIDPCFSCNDRMVLVKPAGKDRQVWTWDALRRYGIEYYKP